jgi:uncharacterized protein (TIGR00297 family)
MPLPSLLPLVIGLAAGLLVSAAAYRIGALTPSGFWAAAITGGLVFGLGGWPWAALLLTFFITSSGLSKAFARRKRPLDEKFAKGSRRDAGQVLANGGLAALLALGLARWPEAAALWVLATGALAAVNADTWATELGVLSPTAPRLITTGRPTERGASGAISLVGTLAGFGGALLVGSVAALAQPHLAAGLVLAAGLGGLGGALVDSLLGATLQAIFYCPTCQKETERTPLHLCGTPTLPYRGLPWLDNDWVNFLCSLAGALFTWGLWRLFT